MNQTNPKVIFIVVGTASIMALTFFGVMGSLLFVLPHFQFNQDGTVLFDKLFSAFVTAGMSGMSFLFGTLVNTRTAPPATDGTTQTITTPPNVATTTTTKPAAETTAATTEKT